jgi:protein tyrosine phosphatase (PTP) superfamily phosphohydrolase (DUF442 family)
MTRLAAVLVAITPFVLPLGAQGGEPDNLVKWREGLASSAQPDARWLAGVKERGYDLVINLAPPQSQGSIANEGGIVGSKGVVYLNIPVEFGAPTAENFRVFSEAMKASRGKNVFVHCQVNMRGSAFVFLYRVIYEDAPVSQAIAQLTGVWKPDKVWMKFIQDTLAAHGKQAEIL